MLRANVLRLYLGASPTLRSPHAIPKIVAKHILRNKNIFFFGIGLPYPIVYLLYCQLLIYFIFINRNIINSISVICIFDAEALFFGNKADNRQFLQQIHLFDVSLLFKS